MKKSLLFLAIMLMAICIPSSSFSMIVINEFLADVPAGLAGDANKDGIRHASDDEFIELYNNGNEAVDISGWKISDAASVRHQFADGVLITGLSRLVIFGGGNLNAFEWPALMASTGLLSLNNSADEIFLYDALGQIIDHVVYGSEANQDQSLTRFPEGSGPFQIHGEVTSRGLPFSPGTDANGHIGQAPSIPEFPTHLLLLSGFMMGLIIRRSRPAPVYAHSDAPEYDRLAR